MLESLGEAMLALGLVLRQGGFFPNVQERKVTGSLLWLACCLPRPSSWRGAVWLQGQAPGKGPAPPGSECRSLGMAAAPAPGRGAPFPRLPLAALLLPALPSALPTSGLGMGLSSNVAQSGCRQDVRTCAGLQSTAAPAVAMD